MNLRMTMHAHAPNNPNATLKQRVTKIVNERVNDDACSCSRCHDNHLLIDQCTCTR